VNRRVRPLVAVASVALLAAACSSTSHGRANSSTRASSAAATRATTTSGSAASAGGAPAGPLGAGVGSTSSPSSSGAGPRSASSQPGAGIGAGDAAGPADLGAGGHITVGIQFSTDLSAAFAAFGANGVKPAQTNARPTVTALVDWINTHGGVGGRKVDAVLHETDPTRGTFDEQAQEACADFTEDHKVDVVVSGSITPSTNVVDCLSGRGVPVVWEYQFLVDQATFDRHPATLYQPFSINGDRLRVYVDSLVAQGFFGSNPKIGLLRYDTPLHQSFSDRVIKPALAAHHLAVAQEIAIRAPSSAAAAGDTAAQLSNAVLRFRSAGVDHLLFAPSGGAVPFIFGPLAQSQGYHPRYALNSLDIPRFVAENLPPGQLHGALGVGWTPAGDLFDNDLPGRNDAAEATCFAITHDHSDFAVRFCDGLFFLKQAYLGARGLKAPDLLAAVDKLGVAFDSPYTFATRFGAGHHDAAAAVRTIAYDDGCRCFRYEGPLVPVP
jgi:ABC-type branched-subunit amino acid transport system substrate-binding protein